MTEKKDILIIVDHLDSMKHGGGARTSVLNFLLFFQKHFNLTYLSIEYLNKKHTVPSKPPGIHLVISHYPKSTITLIIKIFNFCISNKESFIYLNGFYSKSGTMLPLLLLKLISLFLNTPQLVLAPRGGVSKGALSIKKIRKVIYLKALHHMGIFKNVRFHAVTKDERDDICKILGGNYLSQCFEAPNLVKPPIKIKINKKASPIGNLRLVFLARLHKIKNLSFLSDVFSHVKTKISLDIYGLVEDQKYFQRAMILFKEKNPSIKVNYCGAPNQEDVSEILGRYELYVLPTLGENFGHSIYEALNAGTPVLVSNRTPWKKTKNLTVQVESLKNPSLWGKRIDKISKLNIQEKIILKKQAARQARKWFEDQKFVSDYENLFL